MSLQAPKGTILVVDDAPENIDLLRAILVPDYALKVALNGEKALKIAFSETPPDVILLDVMMPGMDGFEVCRRIKADPVHCHIPVIFITSLEDAQDRELGLRLGAADFLCKPFDADVVLRSVASQLGR